MARRSPQADADRAPSTENDKDWVCLAVVGAPKGVKGAVRLTCFTEEPENVAAYGPLSVGPGGRLLTFRIVEPATKKDQVVVAIEGVADRDAAAALTGARLYIRRADLPQPGDPDEFYFHDLIGLKVRHVDGRELGTVQAVQDYGAGIFLDVLPSGARATFVLPFTLDAVPEVDVAGGFLVADPPAGLLDDA
jgi:16S rRNA processing protein RimM